MEFYTGRMGKILAGIQNETNMVENRFENNFIRNRIQQRTNDWKKGIMIVCDGDMTQFEAMNRMTIADYLLRLEIHVKKYESIK